LSDVPYLKTAVERGYRPESLEQVTIAGDLKSIDDVDQAAARLMPYDDEFYQWQDVSKEFKRLNSPMRFFWGPYKPGGSKKCLTGCAMGIKMFLACFEKYAGAEAFSKAKPVVFIMGNVEEEIDVKGSDAFLFGACAKAKLKNVRKVIKIDKCFTTVTDMMVQCGARMGIPAPITDKNFVLPIARNMLVSAGYKLVNMRYAQDIGYFLAKRLDRRI
jgi:hypothetical protein